LIKGINDCGHLDRARFSTPPRKHDWHKRGAKIPQFTPSCESQWFRLSTYLSSRVPRGNARIGKTHEMTSARRLHERLVLAAQSANVLWSTPSALNSEGLPYHLQDLLHWSSGLKIQRNLQDNRFHDANRTSARLYPK
jgi:hypothetical protein